MLAPTLLPVDLEWLSLCTRRPNVLITGSNDLVCAVLIALTPLLQRPIVEWTPDTNLPRRDEPKTLLIRDIGALSLPHQCTLLHWQDESETGRIQVVSTSTFELLHLVHGDAFLDRLYYRLNVIRLDALTSLPVATVTPPAPAAPRSDPAPASS